MGSATTTHAHAQPAAAASSASAPNAAAPSEARRMLWFTISGWIGTALFYLLYEFIIARGALSRPLCGVGWIDKLEWASVAWTSAYLASIVWQHALHRALVFGSESAYWPSLAWTYVSYSLSIVLSSVFQHAMVAWMGVNHRVAFGASLVATGVINYFTLKNAFEAPKQKKVGVE